MTDFRAKLRRRLDASAEGGIAEQLRARLARLHTRTPARLPPGEDLANERGRCFLRRMRYGLDHMHGRVPLRMLHALDRDRLVELSRDPAWRDLQLAECLFLDTETTGLSGGAGTVVFLIGLAWIEADALLVEQVFLRSFGEEAAALQHVAERLRDRPVPVTFVGKTFDRHRLASRMALHRIEAPVLTTRHLDLYYLARRARRADWPDVRLRTVEQHVLGLRRDGDLPGAEAPAAFLSYLRDGSGPIEAVFEHNRLDVISLAALLAAL